MYPKQIDFATIERMDGTVTLTVLERMLEDAKSVAHDFMADGFSKEQTMTYLWFCMSNDRMPRTDNHMSSVELDTIHFEDEYLEFLRVNDIRFEIITWHGPGGGHPLVKYMAYRQDLVHLIREKFDDMDLCEDIKEIV